MKCSALCYQNFPGNLFPERQDDLWQQREAEYIKIINNFGKEARAAEAFTEMTFYLLPNAMTERISDVLGEVYMEAGIGNKNTGQFFTPFHVSYMSAQMGMQDILENWDGESIITMNEPSCGAGGMALAAAQVMLDHGINPQQHLKIVAQDLDWKAVYMCYLQLSVLGLKAVVVQGDTLSKPYVPGYPPERVFRTFTEMGLPVWMLKAISDEQHGKG